MSHADAPMDDLLLSAWLDAELPADEQARVDAWLREHPEGAARVQAWAADRDALRAQMAPLLHEAPPVALSRQVLGAAGSARPAAGPQHLGAQRPWKRAAAAAALLLAGALLGAGGLSHWQRWELARQGGAARTLAGAAATQGWVQRAAVAHSVYVPEQRHPVEVRAQEEHLARWLTRRTSVPVKLFDLHEQGFELVGGRLLPDAAGPSAQLMYENAAGQRVTVYLRKPDAETATGFRYERQGDLGLFYWVEPGVGYALVGSLPKERLLALAQAIHAQDPAQKMPAR